MAYWKHGSFLLPSQGINPLTSVETPEGKLRRKLGGINSSITGSKSALGVLNSRSFCTCDMSGNYSYMHALAESLQIKKNNIS